MAYPAKRMAPIPSEAFETDTFWTGEARNWAGGLPRDVLVSVFQRVGLAGVLFGAELVCSPWRTAAKEATSLLRRISVGKDDGYCSFELLTSVKRAVDRSNGRLEEFWISEICDDELLFYVTKRASNLKSLRLISCKELTAMGLADAVKGLKQLEELEIRRCPLKRKVVQDVDYNRRLGNLEVTFSSLDTEVVEVVGQECPLKRFKLKHGFSSRYYIERSDEEAIAIAKTMHQLRYLQLFGDRITNEGLKAIIGGCPFLETLDLRECGNLEVNAEMQALCSGINTLVLPDENQEQETEFVTDTAGCKDDHSDSDDDFDYDYADDAAELYRYEEGDGFWRDDEGNVYHSTDNMFICNDRPNKWLDDERWDSDSDD